MLTPTGTFHYRTSTWHCAAYSSCMEGRTVWRVARHWLTLAAVMGLQTTIMLFCSWQLQDWKEFRANLKRRDSMTLNGPKYASLRLRWLLRSYKKKLCSSRDYRSINISCSGVHPLVSSGPALSSPTLRCLPLFNVSTVFLNACHR